MTCGGRSGGARRARFRGQQGRRSARQAHKQTIAGVLDEVQKLGYVHRAIDLADRAKVLMRTGRALMRISAEFDAEIQA